MAKVYEELLSWGVSGFLLWVPYCCSFSKTHYNLNLVSFMVLFESHHVLLSCTWKGQTDTGRVCGAYFCDIYYYKLSITTNCQWSLWKHVPQSFFPVLMGFITPQKQQFDWIQPHNWSISTTVIWLCLLSVRHMECVLQAQVHFL